MHWPVYIWNMDNKYCIKGYIKMEYSIFEKWIIDKLGLVYTHRRKVNNWTQYSRPAKFSDYVYLVRNYDFFHFAQHTNVKSNKS